MSTVLGIDGGGTKTLAVVAVDGQTRGRAEADSCSLRHATEEQVRARLEEACHSALAQAGVSAADVRSVCAGVSGISSSREAGVRTASILRGIFSCPVAVVGDQEIALDAAFRGAPGVVVVSGTGSIAFGRNAQRDTARAGGFGSLVSDEGSGYWIGRQAVLLSLQENDAGEAPELMEWVLKRFNAATAKELVELCNRQPPPDLAELAPVVMQASEHGDPLAGSILDDAGRQLARLCCMVGGRLWLNFEKVEVAMTGGIFVHSARVRRAFAFALAGDFPNAAVRLSEAEPVEGAIFRAEQAPAVDERA